MLSESGLKGRGATLTRVRAGATYKPRALGGVGRYRIDRYPFRPPGRLCNAAFEATRQRFPTHLPGRGGGRAVTRSYLDVDLGIWLFTAEPLAPDLLARPRDGLWFCHGRHRRL